MGEVLDGDRMAISLYEVNFNLSSSHKELCTRELSNKDIEKLQAAIEDLYYFEFVFGKKTFSMQISSIHALYVVIEVLQLENCLYVIIK